MKPANDRPRRLAVPTRHHPDVIVVVWTIAVTMAADIEKRRPTARWRERRADPVTIATNAPRRARAMQLLREMDVIERGVMELLTLPWPRAGHAWSVKDLVGLGHRFDHMLSEYGPLETTTHRLERVVIPSRLRLCGGA